jgi:hypothetical protein
LIIIKSKKQSNTLSKIGYNPNKRMQFVPKYGQNSFYIGNIKEEFLNLLNVGLSVILAPFALIAQLIMFITSINYWTFIYTPKKFIYDQTVFCYCPQCNNELVSSNSFVKEDEYVNYQCTECGCEST